jgi:hypothetical protein
LEVFALTSGGSPASSCAGHEPARVPESRGPFSHATQESHDSQEIPIHHGIGPGQTGGRGQQGEQGDGQA